MDHIVEVCKVIAEQVAVARGAYPPGAVADVLLPLMGRAMDYVKKRGIKNDGRIVGIYKDAIEGGVRVLESFEGSDGVYCTTTPAGLAARVRYVGPWRTLGRAHKAILAWSKASGRKLAGVNWEVYGHHTNDESKQTTDIYYLLVG